MRVAELLPLAALGAGALSVLFIGILKAQSRTRIAQVLTLISLAASLVLFVRSAGGRAFGGVFMYDTLSIILILTAVISAFLFTAFAIPYLTERRKLFGSEFFFFLLTALAGVIVMVCSGNLLIIVIGLEMLSVSLYFLAAMDRTSARGIEGAVKYFIMGAVALAFMLYGISLVYGFTHTIELERAVGYAAVNSPYPLYFYLGVLFILIGFSFKLALVPFHFWAPDAYEGSSVLSTGIMSVLPKIAAFAVLAKVAGFFFASQSTIAGGERMIFLYTLAALAVLSMIVGNVLALAQPSLKRLLAFSAIVHSGFIASVLITEGGVQQAALYLAAYAATSAGMFAVLTAIADENDGNLTLMGLNGLSARSPVLAALAVLFIASYAGLPPLAGFIGKFYVFKGLIESGYEWLAVIGIINALLSIAYYLKIIMAMYAYNGEASFRAQSHRPSKIVTAAAFIAAILVVAIGVWPNMILGFF
ncbi:MAG: NADH-quinone oxidoreductase subunit N [Spirochaetota bacterium]